MPEFYNGAIDFQPVEEEDQRPKINAACEPGCSSAWKNYLACGERIEAVRRRVPPIDDEA